MKKRGKNFQNIRIIYGIGIFIIIFTSFLHNTRGFEPIYNTNLQKYESEQWTFTFATEYEDRGIFLAEIPNSDDIVMAMSSKNIQDEEYAIYNRISDNGTLIWTRTIEGFFNIKYSSPVASSTSLDGSKLYSAFAYTNETDTKLGLLEINLLNGTLEKITPLSNSFEGYAVMDWIAFNRLGIAYSVLQSPYGNKINITYYNTLQSSIISVNQIPSVEKYNVPVSINYNPDQNQTILAISKLSDSVGVFSSVIYSIDFNENNLNIRNEQIITLDSSNYELIDIVLDTNAIYLAMHRNTIFNLVKIDFDFQLQYWSQWIIEDVEWLDMNIDSNGILKIVGSGTQGFGIDSSSDNQGILAEFQSSPETNTFYNINIFRFGMLQYKDYFVNIIQTTKGAIYLTGYGKSYGDSNHLVYNAYLIQYQANSIEPKIDNDVNNTIFQRNVMIGMISGFLVLIAVVTIIETKRKKNSEKK